MADVLLVIAMLGLLFALVTPRFTVIKEPSSARAARLQLGSASTGSATTRGVEETWSVQDARNIKRINVTLRVPGRRVPIRYETIIPYRD
jgi:type II secretory pathway pseudopilin PulG